MTFPLDDAFDSEGYKTLQMNFYRPGDEFDAREDEIQLGVDGHPNYQWLYRTAPATFVPARPVQ